MKATDMWSYLCACHPKPQNCSAIDYMVHSLDHATNTINDPANFKDHLDVEDRSRKHLQSIARRLYRLFSHAHFHHEEVFAEFEANTRLCLRFT